MADVDVVVLGAGPAGENAAGRAAGHGLRVVIVEPELVGGECSYWGCIPSKTLIRPGDVLAAVRRVPGAAEAVTGSVDVAAALARRDYMTSNWNDEGQLPWLEEHAIELVRGHGRLAGRRVVDVDLAGGELRRIEVTHAVVVATGTTAAMPPIDGLADVGAWTNREVTEAKAVPQRLLVLGGGAIGAEMAQAFRRLGSAEVTVVEAADRLLFREEPFAGQDVREAFESDGMRVVTGTALEKVRRVNGEVVAHLADGEDVRADEILVAVGRRPRTSDIGLETVGLEPGKPVAVDDRLRAIGVDDDWLYAVGDANGLSLLTHVGKYQARIAGDVIAGIDMHDRVSRDVVPRVTFTDPQVCAVGLTESQARERYADVRVVQVGTADVAGAATSGRGVRGHCQLVIDNDRRVIVGATFTGPDIADLLHSATIAVAAAVPLEVLWHAVPSFPTISEVWLRLLEEAGL